jgi:hypothetical protein
MISGQYNKAETPYSYWGHGFFFFFFTAKVRIISQMLSDDKGDDICHLQFMIHL